MSVAKTDFLSKVSHEIRTPLNGVLGMSEEALESLEQKNYKKAIEALTTLRTSGDYLMSIINNVLDMSKIEKGKMPINYSNFNLNDLIDEIVEVLSGQIKSKNIDFKKIINFDTLNINTDRIKLSQILMNILSNSIKYTNNGGHITFSCLAYNMSDKKIKLNIEVSDTGIGMSEEFVKHIFEPFNQEGRKTKVIGSGLGMSITKSLVTLLNGNIEVKSELNKGSVFSLSIVCDYASQEVNKLDDALNSDFSKIRLLLAEDNEINILVCKNLLNKYKFKYDIAKNGEEAYEMFKASKPGYYDLILMDIQMPVMDGFEATKAIRMLDRRDNNLTIIALSADAFAEDVNKALNSQMDGHIAKPINQKEFIQTIYRLLKTKGKI
jgi:CheY-like chemotaxis protein/two-component sensor histidine kinase